MTLALTIIILLGAALLGWLAERYPQFGDLLVPDYQGFWDWEEDAPRH